MTGVDASLFAGFGSMLIFGYGSDHTCAPIHAERDSPGTKATTLRDTVGKLGRRGKIRSGGCRVFENTITLANARRNRTDREVVVARE